MLDFRLSIEVDSVGKMPLKKEHPCYGVVYEIKCTISGKSYIGVTIRTLSRRWQAHVRNAHSGSQTALAFAIRKYGAENFAMTAIASCWDHDSLMATEQLIIVERKTRTPNGYNLSDGGRGTLNPSPQTRLKKRMALLGKKQCRELVEKRIAPLRGRKVPRDVVEIRASKQRGQKRRSWGRHTAASIDKMRIGAKERNRESITKAIAISAAKRLGTTMSAATRAKMSASHKARLSNATTQLRLPI